MQSYFKNSTKTANNESGISKNYPNAIPWANTTQNIPSSKKQCNTK